MADKVVLTGGGFQDAEGNVLANGYLTMKLNQDEQSPSEGQIGAGITLTIPLDENGDIADSPEVWPNDVLIPTNSYYIVFAFTEEGQQAWGPFYGTVDSPSPFDVTTWVPAGTAGATINAFPVIQVNDVNAEDQSLLDLVDSDSITFTDLGNGQITAEAAVSETTRSIAQVSFDGFSTSYVLSGIQSGTQQTVGTISSVPANSKETASLRFTGAASPVVQTNVSFRTGSNSSFDTNVLFTLGSVNRLSFRLRINNSNCRYWIGFYNAVTTLNGALFATDTPNTGYIGFRCKNGAISIASGTDNTHQTIAPTGVSVDTANSQLFEIVLSNNGTSAEFFIDGSSVGVINSNLIGAGSLSSCFWTGDNENLLDNAEDINFYWVRVAMK